MTYGSEAARSSQAVPGLGQLIISNDRRRAGSWRAKFILTWVVILAALTGFLGFSGGFDPTFMAKNIPYIVGGGVGLTLVVSFVSITLAIVLATFGALGRLSRNPLANGVASFYVSLVRGTPLLLQILFIYLSLPQVGLVFPELACGILALGFNYGAYMTEIFRAGIQAVPGGQTEAAESLGMSGRTTFLRIILPQAFRIVTPAIGNDFIAMLKDSSLVSVIAVQELLWRSQQIGRRDFKTMQTLLIAAAVYWAMTLIFSYFQSKLERRMATGDRASGAPR